MKVISAITLSELTDILQDLIEYEDLEGEYEVLENAETDSVSIFCTIFGMEFFIFPFGAGPFYDGFLLSATFGAHLDPELLCTEFNSRHKFANAAPVTIESEENNDADDVVIIEVEKLVLLKGGVTDEHIKEIIQLWTGMLMHAEELFEGAPAESE